jgi:hypothetical protein
VVNRPPDEREARVLADYLRNGGSVLTCRGSGERVLGISSYGSRVEYLTSRAGELFGDLMLLDVGADCLISHEANLLSTEGGNNAVFAGPWRGGHVVDLPFDPAELMLDARSAMRLFHAAGERLPFENVSYVAKGELRLLFHRALEFLHHARGFPYAHLWYFPRGAENCFALRIDTDGAPGSDVEVLHALGEQRGIPFSWYLDVKSHRGWLDVFKAMTRDEMGVHCYTHRTFESHEENAANITLALKLMSERGLSVRGFAAPYGQWNPGLARAVDETGFLYSSEFSYAFDTLPLYPAAGEKRFEALQVPVHPVCIGSMRRVGYTSHQMIHYFQHSMESKLCRSEPLFYYHHPADQFPEVVGELLDGAGQAGILHTTLGDFAEWWKMRERVEVELETDGMEMKFRQGSDKTPVNDVWIAATNGKGMKCRAPLSTGSLGRSDDIWQRSCTAVPPPDIRRIREFDARSWAADQYNKLLRKVR